MTNPNDPASPQHGWSSDPAVLERMKTQLGLSKREEFAKAAMTTFVTTTNGSWQEADAPMIARVSVAFADALIAELNKPRQP